MNGLQEKIGLWAYRHYQDMHSISRRRVFAHGIEYLWCSILESLAPRCWHKDCKSHGEPCIVRGYGQDDQDDEDLFYWYCSEHAQRHGFCFGCGEFWGGTESFDFGPGYCSNCASEFEDDYDEDLVDDWSYDEE